MSDVTPATDTVHVPGLPDPLVAAAEAAREAVSVLPSDEPARVAVEALADAIAPA